MSCVTIFCENGKYDRSQYLPLPRHSPPWTATKQRRLFDQACSVDTRIRAVAANHPMIYGFSSFGLSFDVDVTVRRAAVRNPAITASILIAFLDDVDPGIRAYAKMRLEDQHA